MNKELAKDNDKKYKGNCSKSDALKGLRTKAVTVTMTVPTKVAADLESRKGYPLRIDSALEASELDVDQITAISVKLYNMKPIDLGDCEQVSRRLSEYFEAYTGTGLKPTVAGMALALGMDRSNLLMCVNTEEPKGHLTKETVALIKRAYSIQETMWENYMTSGKINPVAGIFLAKNNFGYKDQTQLDVKAIPVDSSDYDTLDIKKRYAIDAEYTDHKN